MVVCPLWGLPGMAESWHAEVHGSLRAPVDLREFVLGAGEANLESLDFTEPAFPFGLGDAADKVVADLG